MKLCLFIKSVYEREVIFGIRIFGSIDFEETTTFQSSTKRLLV